MEAIL